MHVLDVLELELSVTEADVWLKDSNQIISEKSKCDEVFADLVCPRAFLILAGLKDALFAAARNDPPVMEDAQPDLLGLHPFGLAAKSALLDLGLHAKTGLKVPLDDDFLHCLLVLAEKEDPVYPVWMVWTCQMLMDIHELMDFDFERGIHDFQGKIAADLVSIRQALLTLADGPETTSEPSIVKDLREAESDLEGLSRDHYHEAQQRLYSTSPARNTSPPKFNV